MVTFPESGSLFIEQCPLNFTSGDGRVSIKVGAKLLSDVVIFSIYFSEILLDFQK